MSENLKGDKGPEPEVYNMYAAGESGSPWPAVVALGIVCLTAVVMVWILAK